MAAQLTLKTAIGFVDPPTACRAPAGTRLEDLLFGMVRALAPPQELFAVT